MGQVALLAARLVRLGSGWPARPKIVAATLVLGMRRLLGRPGERPWTLRLRIGDRAQSITVCDYGELMVIRDVLLDEEYALPADAAPEVILDVGANIGVSVLFFRARYPDARIVAVEPDRRSFERLARNVGPDPRVDLVHAAAASEAGEVTLFRTPGFSIAASLTRRGDDEATPVAVHARTLDDICDELGADRIDVLKLDVEGAELEALRGFSRLEEVGYVLGEAHPTLIDGRVAELFERLKGFHVRVVSANDDSLVFGAVARRITSPKYPRGV